MYVHENIFHGIYGEAWYILNYLCIHFYVLVRIICILIPMFYFFILILSSSDYFQWSSLECSYQTTTRTGRSTANRAHQFLTIWPLYPPVTGGFLSHRVRNAGNISMSGRLQDMNKNSLIVRIRNQVTSRRTINITISEELIVIVHSVGASRMIDGVSVYGRTVCDLNLAVIHGQTPWGRLETSRCTIFHV